MKPLLIALTIGALFVAGAAGTYFLMPIVAPERVAEARQYLDSLDAVAVGDTARFAPVDSALALMDSAVVDTTSSALDGLADSTTLASADAEAPASATAEVSAPSPPDPAQGAAVAQAEQARELSNVIAKLEDPELRALVSNLDPDVLTVLYRESSARNKTRLLQAIPPERAAQFVRGLIVPVSSNRP